MYKLVTFKLIWGYIVNVFYKQIDYEHFPPRVACLKTTKFYKTILFVYLTTFTRFSSCIVRYVIFLLEW